MATKNDRAAAPELPLDLRIELAAVRRLSTGRPRTPEARLALDQRRASLLRLLLRERLLDTATLADCLEGTGCYVVCDVAAAEADVAAMQIAAELAAEQLAERAAGVGEAAGCPVTHADMGDERATDLPCTDDPNQSWDDAMHRYRQRQAAGDRDAADLARRELTAEQRQAVATLH